MEIFAEAIGALKENSILMQVLSTPRLHSSLDKINFMHVRARSNVTSFFFNKNKIIIIVNKIK